MSTVTRDLGSVTAYASAVEGGYGGSYEQFCADMANISESSGMIPGIVGAIPIESASGDIVAFDDGAGDAPVYKLNVELNPKQDFNGYTYAWADGCGKNILNQNIYVTNSGNTAITFGQSVGYGTPSVLMKAGTYTYSAVYKNGAESRGYMKKEGDSSNTMLWEVGSDHATFTLAEDILCSFWVYNSAGIERENVDVQIESGSTATDYEPYRNISPVIDFTDVTITQSGKNLLEQRTTSGSSNDIQMTPNNDGSFSYSGTFREGMASASVWLERGTLPPGTYTVTGCPAGGSSTKYRMRVNKDNYSASDPIIGYEYGNGLTFTLTEETYVIIGGIVYKSGLGETIDGQITFRPMIRLASDTDSTFEKYVGETYDITIPTSAGTVYGGTIDVNEDGSGILTVTKGYWTPTSSTGTGTMSQSANGNRCGFACDFTIPANTANILCSCGTPDSNVNSGSNANWVIGHCALYHGTQGTDYFRFIFPTTITTAADGLQYLIDNDCEVVYNLTNPIIYNLTAPQVKTLLGKNVMWADSGAMSVDYRANLGMYFEKRENKTRQIIAGVETTNKATQNYYAGDMMIVGDALCIATTAISSGSTFVVGSNIIETTVAEQLLLLGNL